MTSKQTHSFHWEIKRPVWPPFYATAFFVPRLKVSIRNDGAALEEVGLTTETREYDGPLGNLPSVTEGWVDIHYERIEGPWLSGDTRRFKIQIPSGTIPRAGTYAVRLRITHWVLTGTPQEELSRQLRETQRPQQALEFLVRPGGGSFRGEQVFQGMIFEYLRVEPLSTVLAFCAAAGTAIAAFATVAAVWLS